MQISCERCSTSYVLDDALIPAAGAPVQCTRCGLVFTAKPPAPGEAKPGAPQRSSTQVFGTSPAAQLAQSNPNQTMVFGTRPAPVPAAGSSSTQMFGAVGSPPVPQPANAGSSTQMFGAVGGGAPSANATLVFGAGGKPAVADASRAAGNSTMMFGAVGSQPTPQPAAKPAGSSTMMFGAVGSEPAPAKPAGSTTQMFGAIGTAPTQPSAQRPGNTTQMFGAVGSEPAPAKPAGSTTQMFGAVGSQPAGNQTLVFGAGGKPAVANEAKPAGGNTMMFGSVGSEPAPTPAGSTTQMFGAVGSAPSQPAGNQTLVFGAGGRPTVANEAKPAGSSTMMFGSVGSAQAPTSPAPNPVSSTQMFGAIGDGPAAPAPRAVSSTQMFGAVGSAPPPAASAPKLVSSTQMFGAVGSAPTPVVPASNPVSSTQMFGAVGSEPVQRPTTDPDFDPPDRAPQRPTTEPAAPRPNATMMFGAATGATAPVDELPPTDPPRSATTTFGTPPAPGSAPSWQAPPPVEADFSPQSQPASEPAPSKPAPAQPRRTVTGASTAPFAGVGQPAFEDDALARKLANRNRNILLGVMAVVLLGGAAAFGIWFVNKPSGPPAEVVKKTAEAFGSVETDTVASLESSRTMFSALEAASPPTYVAPAADELVVMSFQLADLRAEEYAAQAEFSQLEKEHARADADHSRADWRTVVNSLVDRMKEIRARIEPIQKKELKLNEDQNTLFRKLAAVRSTLEAPSPELDRAFGIYYAFKGSDQAARFAQTYKTAVPNDGWADLITAALADQPRQTEGMLKSGLAAAQSAIKQNPRLTRAKRVAAELQLQLHDFDGAKNMATELSLLAPGDPRVKLLEANIDAASKVVAPVAPTP